MQTNDQTVGSLAIEAGIGFFEDTFAVPTRCEILR